MGLPPEKYSYKVIGIIMATFIDKLNLHDVSKTMFFDYVCACKRNPERKTAFQRLKSS